MAAGGALAVVGVVVAIISSHAWVAGGAIACVVAIAALHRHVWRWPPAAWAVVIVLVVTVAGGFAGWGIARALHSSSQPSPAPSGVATTNTVPAGPGHPETVGGSAKTWSDYVNAGGREGPTIQAQQTVKVACRVRGFRVNDGDTWWYRVVSPPWDGQYYVTADAFYNNGRTSGPLRGTPFVDGHVRAC